MVWYFITKLYVFIQYFLVSSLAEQKLIILNNGELWRQTSHYHLTIFA